MFALSQTYCVGARRYSVGTMRGTVHTLYQIHCVGARRYSVGTMRGTVHTLYRIHCVGARRYSAGTMRGTVHTLYQIRCVGARRYSVGTERYTRCLTEEMHGLCCRGRLVCVCTEVLSACLTKGGSTLSNPSLTQEEQTLRRLTFKCKITKSCQLCLLNTHQ